MHRRLALAGLAAGVSGGWLPAHAQPGTRIGFLSSRAQKESQYLLGAFHKGLAETGFVEGRNLEIAWRWAEGRFDRLPELAAELVAARVSVILAAGGPPAALAARDATTMIPIVFAAAGDPVRLGIVTNLSRPGGNITGMSTFSTDLAIKALELMREIVPTAEVIALMTNPSNPSAANVDRAVQAAAPALGIRVPILHAAADAEIESAYASLASLKADALVVYGDPLFDSRREKIVALSARFAKPVCYQWRDYVAAGGLLSLGTSLVDSYRRAAIYVGRILKGERPGDLPVQEPTRFELTVNLATARMLGLTIPPAVLGRADELIE